MNDDKVIVVKRGDLEASPAYQYLTLLLTSMVFMKGLDFIKDSHYYKPPFSAAVNTVHRELYTMMQRELVALMANGHQERTYLVADGIEEAIHELILVKPEFAGVIAIMIKRLRQDPGPVLEFFGLNLTNELIS